mmetsp:Transcript_27547/g.59218  ORF Transcript_27547/g.59218 Transcript_27547/m.59218 type:complete len:1496 (+) Transcript_27547:194-4681(+)
MTDSDLKEADRTTSSSVAAVLPSPLDSNHDQPSMKSSTTINKTEGLRSNLTLGNDAKVDNAAPIDLGSAGHVDGPVKCAAKKSEETRKKDNTREDGNSGEKLLRHSNSNQKQENRHLRKAGKVEDGEPRYKEVSTTTKGGSKSVGTSKISKSKEYTLGQISTPSNGSLSRLSSNQSLQTTTTSSSLKSSRTARSRTSTRSSRTTSARKSRTQSKKVPLNSTATTTTPTTTTPDRGSLLTKGMSLFSRSSKQMRYAKNYDDDRSVMSELSQDMKSQRSVGPKFEKNNDDALRQHLEEQGLLLLKRLIEFLSDCPPAPDEGGRKKENSKQKKKQRGLTLPASAIGWLSTQVDETCGDAFEGIDDCYQIPKQQLRGLQKLLKRVTSLRISGEAWPPPHASSSISKKRAATTNPEKVGMISSKILSTFSTGDQSIACDSLDDESCGATSSVGNETEIVVSAFQRYYHELQAKPDVNMSFFPHATKLVVDGIPPNWVRNLDLLQSLEMFQMEKGCILDVNQLFFPSDISPKNANIQQSPLLIRRDLSLIDEGNEKEGARPLPDDDGDTNQPENSSFVVYPSLSKLRVSNCAMGEAAGLRGRVTSKSVPQLPTLSRFPNLTSLNLSRNELFKSKTVFAGLSSLPLLSSINLSYNRLTSLDNIFMHIGNVTELILTGNEISSTRGLDRLFSLERLSLDENKIHNLANIAGIAKIPFLMNFDLNGNPYFETDDPTSCRIKVFNLFREVRCNGLPKDATYRDMQRLLPILDNELATKDELVALKDLTFRQTVISVDSVLSPENKKGDTDSKTIDDSSEISVNMPDAGSGGIRRIVKSSPAKSAHFRMAGSASLEKKASRRLERFHGHVDSSFERKDRRRQVGVRFNMAELITSIRPESNTGDYAAGNSVLREMSFSSHRGEVKDDTVAYSQKADFPFSLPPALLAEANDDTWTPSMQMDLLVPSDKIVWEALPSDDKVDQLTADAPEQENVITDNGDTISVQCDEDPSENTELHSPANVDGGSFCPDDETQIPSVNEGQESVEKYGHGSDSDNDVDEISDLKSRKSMFGGIWEQSYRANVTNNNAKADIDPADSTEQTTSELFDFTAAEQNSQYDGPSDYGPLFVSSDLDLYFDSYIFHRDSSEGDLQGDNQKRRIMAPRIQLFKFDRDLLINSKTKSHGTSLSSAADFYERYIGVWKQDVLACGSYAQSRLAPIRRRKRGFHGDTITKMGKDIMISESRKFIICLSDSALYFIIDDETSPDKSTGGERSFPSRVPANSTFSDARWPHAVVRHSLDSLRGITIGFQFQRLILRFFVGNGTNSSSLEYSYVILTSNKLQTVSFLQKLQSHVTDAQPGKGALIDNDDKTFLDALGTPRSNEVVIHYQILHQIWKRGDREASRRAFVLTDTKAYLLDETYNGDGTNPTSEKEQMVKLGDVSLAIIDSAELSRVTEVRAANEDPRKITLVILPRSKYKRSHRWRLVCNDGEGAERLIDHVRKATGGNL